IGYIQCIQFAHGADREDLHYDTHFSNVPNAQPKVLDHILITSGDFEKSFHLDYDYWVDQTSQAATHDYDNKRLRLLSVREKDKGGGNEKPPYLFDYHQKEGAPHFLPNKLSRAIDHWGFYNGAEQNNVNPGSLNIPPTLYDFPVGNICADTVLFRNWIGDSDRESNEAAMKLGTLRKVTYPTGGSSAFTFEANQRFGTRVQTDVEILAEVNRNHPFPGRCEGPPTYSSSDQAPHTVTFTSQQQIDETDYLFELTEALACDCSTTPVNGIGMEIIVRHSSTGPIVDQTGTYYLNCTNHFRRLQQGKLVHLFPNLSPNIPYLFEIKGSNSAGYLKISHTTETMVNDNLAVGGLRIKEIRRHDGMSASNDLVNKFDYSHPTYTDGRSSGVLYQMPVYSWRWKNYGCPGVSTCASTTNGCAPTNPDYNCNPSASAGMWLFDQAIVPLSSFDGNHIGYEHVKVYREGNGYTRYQYQIEDLNPAGPASPNQFPSPPAQIKTLSGNLAAMTVVNEGQQIKAQDQYTPISDSYAYSSDKMFRLAKGGNQCANVFYYTPYRIRTRPHYRLKKRVQALDRVSTTIDYEYNGTDHFFPTATALINSDGKTYRTETDYTKDSNLGGSARQVMLDRHMINFPIAIRRKVGRNGNLNLVGGQENHYALFAGDPRLREQKEKYINGSLRTLLKLDYDGQGNIRLVELRGEPPISYSWDRHRVTKKQVLDWTWTYAYYPNTKMVQTITDLNDIEAGFKYDGFGRLQESSERNGGITNTLAYDYTLADGG
ncbi:MAG: hypothetical protein AAFV80_19885, partial [Bacteroidota bacterium]